MEFKDYDYKQETFNNFLQQCVDSNEYIIKLDSSYFYFFFEYCMMKTYAPRPNHKVVAFEVVINKVKKRFELC